MASIRLCTVNPFLRSLTRVTSSGSPHLIIHRKNHVLAKRGWMTLSQTPVLCDVRGVTVSISPYRLEHTTNNPEIASTNSDKINSQAATSDPSNAAVNPSEASYFDESVLPPVPSSFTDDTIVLTSLGEPTLKSLGLGSWYPSGIMQQILEYYHVHFDLPWWAAITGFTLTLRILLLPLSIRMKRDMANYQNNMPTYQMWQEKLAEARRTGNYYETAKVYQDFGKFAQTATLFGPGMLVPYFVQFPVFVSVYMALRGMAEAVELKSFQTGGLWWFTDLSMPDQYYILPLMTAATIWATIKFGSSPLPPPQQSKYMNITRVIQYGAPVVVFLFSMNFPAATACYWTTTNIFVLCQTAILNTKYMKKLCKIPDVIPFTNMPKSNIPKKGFITGLRESYQDAKLMTEIKDRERMNAIKFHKAGTAPIKRTFKFNPNKISSDSDVLKAEKNN
ncbi:UNVERIFIED_CONTAM: hypothetical protein PYX00_001678 [Menopon gallinae]|uniref:Membrane insertase YidC/Oxa/ALB C-terminal domain-containing protein n=1 Tax=Menopon gallinae TaxID=328185 RepID=A0AAW2IEC4_9NEOP